MKLVKTYGFLKKELDQIEATLQDSIQATHPILRKTSTQLLKAGGKRIRPVFVLLSSKLGEEDISEQAIHVAVSIELIHMATLVHDDVIDHAFLRRGKPTIRSKYDNRVAMYTGDYILACALESITNIQDPNLHQLLSDTIVELCIGEVEQIHQKYMLDQNLRDYLRKIKRKSAILIAACCKLGALLAGKSAYISKQIYKYGYYVGMSYQIIDDILDFTASEKQLGKPVGNDLIQGNVTLPILKAMQNQEFKHLIEDIFADSDEISNAQMQLILAEMKKTDAIEASYELSRRYLSKALSTLECIPDHYIKDIFIDIAKYIGNLRK